MPPEADIRIAHLQKHIRFTESQNDRLRRACAFLGCTIQTFVHESALERLARVEAEMRLDDEYRRRRRDERAARREVKGLGLKRKQEEADQPPARDEIPQPAPSVIVQMPGAAPSGGGDVVMVTMLAQYIVNGSPLMRSMRTDQAREVIASSREGAEREAAYAALDAAVKEREPKRRGALDWLRSGI